MQEIKRLGVDVLGVAETWWADAGVCPTEGGTLYYSGNLERNHRKGVGIVVAKHIEKYVSGFVPYSDRAVLIKLNVKPVNLNIIQVYAPTADAVDEEIEAFYDEVKDLLKFTRKHDINVIMGDFNAKLGSGKCGDLVGPFGLGKRNERGDRLLQFCQEVDMKATNTWFHLLPRRLYTWKTPGDSPDDNLIRNQIDYTC